MLALPLTAQVATVAIPPLFILPNEGRNPMGPVEALEGGAFVARASGVGAVCYNPAGLALSKKSEISSSASAYEWTFYSGQVGNVSDTSSRLSNNGRMFGFVIGEPLITNDRLRIGFAMPMPVSWKTALQMEGAGPVGSGSGQALYSSDGSFMDLVPTLGLGYTLRPGLRVGVSLGMSFLTLKQQQLVRVQGGTATGTSLAQTSFQADGTAYSLLLVGGLQWDVSSTVTLGLALGSPGWRFAGSSNILLQQTTATNAGYQALDLHDPDATFGIHHAPWMNLGVAWRFERGAVELNVKALAPVSSYDIFRSSAPGSLTVADVAGTKTSPVAFGASPDERRTTVNVNLGSRYDLSLRTSLHAGLFTARSPVVAGSTFQQIDIYGVSTGFALRWTNLSGSIGLIYEWGNRDLKLPLPAGTPIANGGIGINSIQMLWGLTYVF